MSGETPLAGGDMNVVVRVGDTVRRPPEPPEVVAPLQWYSGVRESSKACTAARPRSR